MDSVCHEKEMQKSFPFSSPDEQSRDISDSSLPSKPWKVQTFSLYKFNLFLSAFLRWYGSCSLLIYNRYSLPPHVYDGFSWEIRIWLKKKKNTTTTTTEDPCFRINSCNFWNQSILSEKKLPPFCSRRCSDTNQTNPLSVPYVYFCFVCHGNLMFQPVPAQKVEEQQRRTSGIVVVENPL